MRCLQMDQLDHLPTEVESAFDEDAVVAKQYAYDDKMALTAEEVAKAMKDLVEK